MNLRIAIAICIFAVDVWALTRMFATPLSRGARIAWIARITLLPGLGAWLWWRRERLPRPRQ